MTTSPKLGLIGMLLLGTTLTGCSSMIDRLQNVGDKPPLSQFQSPTQQPGYQPISWPSPAPQTASEQYSNSLWQPGARAFFRDQRASRVGDILRVKIHIDDKAQLDNNTNRDRTTKEDLSITGLFGLSKKIPGKGENELGANGTSNADATGKVNRQEKVDTQIAATITQVLPNGNYAIQGKSEIGVNFDVREIAIQGIVRPQDIDSSNTVDSTQVAEARVTYGGRGNIESAQQPRWGQQVVDIISPF